MGRVDGCACGTWYVSDHPERVGYAHPPGKYNSHQHQFVVVLNQLGVDLVDVTTTGANERVVVHITLYPVCELFDRVLFITIKVVHDCIPLGFHHVRTEFLCG